MKVRLTSAGTLFRIPVYFTVSKDGVYIAPQNERLQWLIDLISSVKNYLQVPVIIKNKEQLKRPVEKIF